MHFYESSIITTVDGLHCQVYDNEHPVNSIIVKPKYIPTDKVETDALPYRFIAGRKVNRLNLWADKEKLKAYLAQFRAHYPEYIATRNSKDAESIYFIIPIEKIERVYFPRRGLTELMSIPRNALDPHLKKIQDFVEMLLQSGLSLNHLGITYSTLMGHYSSQVSDINIVVYGKKQFWKLMSYLESANHPLLRWKTTEEWLQFHKRRNRFNVFTENEFLTNMNHKKSEGFFDGTLFILFAAEEENETWCPWGSETYEPLGTVTVEGVVTENLNSVVRPGCYTLRNGRVIEGAEKKEVKRIVFYSRDYCMLAKPGETLRACGLLEKVTPKNGSPVYYRVVVGYVDAYVSDRREKEYVKKVMP